MCVSYIILDIKNLIVGGIMCLQARSCDVLQPNDGYLHRCPRCAHHVPTTPERLLSLVAWRNERLCVVLAKPGMVQLATSLGHPIVVPLRRPANTVAPSTGAYRESLHL